MTPKELPNQESTNKLEVPPPEIQHEESVTQINGMENGETGDQLPKEDAIIEIVEIHAHSDSEEIVQAASET